MLWTKGIIQILSVFHGCAFSAPGFHPGPHIAFSYYFSLDSCSLYKLLSLCLLGSWHFRRVLIILSSAHHFGLICFPHNSTEIFWQEYHKNNVVSFSVDHIIGFMTFTCPVTGDPLVKVKVSARFFYCKFIIFPLVVNILEVDTLRQCISCFSSTTCPLIFVSISGSGLQQLLLWCLPNNDFLVPFLFLH